MATVDYSQSGTLGSDPDRAPKESDQGLIPFVHTVTLATTDIDTTTDRSLLFAFPENAWLQLSSVSVICSDMDSGTDLVLDFGIGDSDGTIDTELIANSTIGQAGGRDNVDSGDLDVQDWLSVSEKYFILGTSTVAATAVAGTVRVEGVYSTNLQASTATA